MELLMAVMEDRGHTLDLTQVVAVDARPEAAAVVIHGLLDDAGEPRDALETDALNDYWVEVPEETVAKHMDADTRIFQVSAPAVGLISASVPRKEPSRG